MRKWWRRICGWFRKPKHIVEVCERDHVKDHVCWDDLWEECGEARLPGNRCWYCNKCGSSWCTPNFHKSWSVLDLERRDRGEHIWAEYMWPEEELIFYRPTPKFILDILKRRKEKRDAESQFSRNSTGRAG